MKEKISNALIILKKKKILNALIILVVLLVVGVVGDYAYGKYAAKNTATSKTRFATAKVTQTNLDVTVQNTGSVSGLDDVNIYSSNNGMVEGLTASAGSVVKQGDVFCKIDDTDTQQAVKDGQYALDQKEIALQAITPQPIKDAESSLEQKQLALQALQLQLANLNIMAPIDGTVKSVFVSAGDDITSTKPAYGGMAIITTGTDDSLEIPVPFPSTQGKIGEVDVKAGQTVKKGDLMFKLDPSTIQNSIDQENSQITQAEKDLQAANNTYQNSLDQENSQIAQAKEDLQNKVDTLNKSTVITPVSGVVSVLNIKNGQMLENSQIALIATVTDVSKMEIQLPVDELDINKVQVGQKATITIDDIPGKTFTGQVQSIAQNGTVTNNVTNYNVVVSVDNPDGVKIGMNANVSIAIQSKENVLAVPSEAIITRNNRKFVMVASNKPTQVKNNSSFFGNLISMLFSSNNNNSNNNNSNGNNNSFGGNTNSSSGKNNGSSGKNNNFSGNANGSGGRLVPVETGIKTSTMTEITSGVTEGETILIQLPQSTSSSNSAGKNGGGMGGGMGAGR